VLKKLLGGKLFIYKYIIINQKLLVSTDNALLNTRVHGFIFININFIKKLIKEL